MVLQQQSPYLPGRSPPGQQCALQRGSGAADIPMPEAVINPDSCGTPTAPHGHHAPPPRRQAADNLTPSQGSSNPQSNQLWGFLVVLFLFFLI